MVRADHVEGDHEDVWALARVARAERMQAGLAIDEAQRVGRGGESEKIATVHIPPSNLAMSAVRSAMRSTRMLSLAACAPSPTAAESVQRRNAEAGGEVAVRAAAGHRFLEFDSQFARQRPRRAKQPDHARGALHRRPVQPARRPSSEQRLSNGLQRPELPVERRRRP